MYLKSIEMQGFKSFANKTRFEFQNGITCIVGPNGSGKSNVADAIRWVFGERSAKSLRSSSMADVIFSGTELRKPQSFAEVTITLDNRDRAIHKDADEVSVTRKVYRSGDSEYLLNGEFCLLKDIQELFYDTGIGKEGYSIIGQGQVDKILSAKPEERRNLFDEACGIVKFKKRKNAALQKLESERQSMLRLTDIITELEKQVGPLKKQSATAQEYLKLRDELKFYDLNSFTIVSANLSETLTKAQSNLELAKKNLEDLRVQDENLKNEYRDVEAELDSLELKINQVRESIHENEKETENQKNEIRILEEKAKSHEDSAEIYRKQMDELKGKIDEKEKKIKESEEKKDSSEADLKILEEALAAKEKEVLDKETERNLYSKTLEESHGKTIDYLTEKGKADVHFQSLETKIRENSEFLNAEKEVLSQIENKLQEKKEEEKSGKRTLLNSENELSEKQKELEGARGEAELAADDFLMTERQHLNLLQSIQLKAGRYETLKGIAERYEGFQPAIRAIMNQMPNDKEICGTVADLIRVKKEYRTLIETALGGNFQNLVVKTEKKAKELVEYLKNERAGRATFLPLDSIRPSGRVSTPELLKEPGVIGSADTLVTYEPEYEPAVCYLLERFLAVDTIEHALAVARKYKYSVRIVTLAGEFVNVGGAITGGAFKNNSNVLGRNEEMIELQNEIQSARTESDELQKSLNRKKQFRDSCVVAVSDLQDEMVRIQLQVTKQKAENDSIVRECLSLDLQRKETLSRIDEVEKEIEKARSEKTTIEETLQKLASENSTDTSVDSVKAFLEEAEARLKVLREEENNLRLKLNASYKDEEYRKAGISEDRAEIEKAKEDILLAKASYDEEKKAAEELLRETADLKSELEKVPEDNGLKNTLSALTEAKDKISESQKAYFEKRNAIVDQITGLEKESVRLEAQIEKADEKLTGITEYVWAEYQLTPSEAVSFATSNPIEDSPAEIHRHASDLKTRIKALGNVNINAIESYKEVSERYEFMNRQYTDLQAAEKDLVSFIDELNEGMRKQFTEEFEKIRVEFNKVYSDLFSGGIGKLELQEGVDCIDCDISIIAQPPGKRLVNMLQLSGGERALTAIALVLAMQHLKPSPFCLLDEIEAALDDTNVVRFTAYVRNFINNTQYIMISHRRGTMVAADRLYGVTMQEKGVSALVGVDLIEKELS